MNSPSSTGRRLRETLTEAQIENLLDVISDAGLLAGLDDLLRATDPDLADTIRRVQSVTSTPPTETPSDQKALETWQSLWSAWQDCVSELGDEHGAYSNQEEHWNPPYFDSYALYKDLEKAAEEMLPWIERVFPLAKDPDLFDEAFTEIGEGIQAYPEWMHGDDDNCDLGPQATACALHWIWCELRDQEAPGRCFVDRVHSMESKCKHVRLSEEHVFSFLKNLPEEICREIHGHLRSPAFFSILSDTRSVWHRIQRDYDNRFDAAAYLATCEEHLSSDWHYGEPLISHAQSRGHLAKAENFIKLTMSSLLRRTSDEPWIPEESIHTTVREMLSELGYEVDSVYDGLQALKAYDKSKEADNPYDHIIMDLTIPGGMGGREAVERVRKRHPEARVIVSSGYANDPVMAHYKDYGFNGRLRKPTELADLAATVGTVLSTYEI